MTIPADDNNQSNQENPGSQLARMREKKGISQEYVAGKLHLRVKVIELLEADDYQNMPEPVFIKGYLRAYAKLLGMAPEPLLATFNHKYSPERKLEKALWQSKRESNFGERIVRWFTAMVAITAIVAVGVWWHKNKDAQPMFASKTAQLEEPAIDKADPQLKLTDLSRMQSMFSTSNEEPASEAKSG